LLVLDDDKAGPQDPGRNSFGMPIPPFYATAAQSPETSTNSPTNTNRSINTLESELGSSAAIIRSAYLAPSTMDPAIFCQSITESFSNSLPQAVASGLYPSVGLRPHGILASNRKSLHGEAAGLGLVEPETNILS
jgi:hypothetical protein